MLNVVYNLGKHPLVQFLKFKINECKIFPYLVFKMCYHATDRKLVDT